MNTITPIRFKPSPVTAEQASKISSVVASCGCTRWVASAHLDAARGDVEAACESWRCDHEGWAPKAAYAQFLGSLEASE